MGYVLVVDEVDKVFIYVICILKILIEFGEMYLVDGRCIVFYKFGYVFLDNIIVGYLDFRMIVLVNRFGFFFFGNDFFGVMGDIFSCYVILNFDMELEMLMLQ